MTPNTVPDSYTSAKVAIIASFWAECIKKNPNKPYERTLFKEFKTLLFNMYLDCQVRYQPLKKLLLLELFFWKSHKFFTISSWQFSPNWNYYFPMGILIQNSYIVYLTCRWDTLKTNVVIYFIDTDLSFDIDKFSRNCILNWWHMWHFRTGIF